jgi:hypothetical protein
MTMKIICSFVVFPGIELGKYISFICVTDLKKESISSQALVTLHKITRYHVPEGSVDRYHEITTVQNFQMYKMYAEM